MNSDTYEKLSAAIDCLERDDLESNFVERIRAIDSLELQIELANDAPETATLIQRAQALKQRLEAANDRLFAHLLSQIKAQDHAALRTYFETMEQQIATNSNDENIGYDELDILVNGLLDVGMVPGEPEARDPDMVFYQPTPARIVLTLLRQLHITGDDVFYDLGSGLGHVPILVNLLTGIKTRGVEIEEAYVRYSNECLNKLCAANVDFVNADARDVPYDAGTIFYLYTPFQGEIMRQILNMLEAQSRQRRIRLCAYGPCTAVISKQNWLQPIYQTGKAEGRLGIFAST